MNQDKQQLAVNKALKAGLTGGMGMSAEETGEKSKRALKREKSKAAKEKRRASRFR